MLFDEVVRAAKKEKEVVRAQVETMLAATSERLTANNCMIAYEPVWAIGTGNTAQPADVQEMHAYIRSLLPAHIRDGVRIIYGGSIKSTNAQSLFALPDVDGGLVGASSLDADEFARIVDAATSVS